MNIVSAISPIMGLSEETVAVERKRILALDGGGVRGVFTIEILGRMEQLIREHFGRPDMVLADHFKFIAGTSTGAIIATLLSWGKPVEDIRKLYSESCKDIFPKRAPWKVWDWPRLRDALYGAEPLSAFLRKYFIDDETQKPALLRTRKLKGTLLVCMRNATTGAAWPITNNPMAKYNRGDHPECNLNIPLWQLVRASTAAPVYFPPEEIEMGNHKFAFVDGGMTPYNNPALIAFLMATLPCYCMEWPTGADKLLLISVGTGRIRSVLKSSSWRELNIGTSLLHAPAGLMENISLQQDFLCRVIGSCIFGDDIDSEVGNLLCAEGLPTEDKKFSYVRYDHRFNGEEIDAAQKDYGGMKLNNTRVMPYLTKCGIDYAEKHVRIEHLL
jgi:patatin-like phospholipase/acyl hydrolase